MHCLNCGNEIKIGQKYCTNCGTKINYKNKILNIILNKKYICLLCIILFVIVFLTVFMQNKPLNEPFKQAEPIITIDYNNLSAKNILDTVIKQDENMFAYCQNSNNDNINESFQIFYNNVINSVNILHDKLIHNFQKEDTGKLVYNDNIILKLVKKSDIYAFISPQTDLYTYQSNFCMDELKINSKYIYNRYSKYLSKAWHDYLFLKAKNDDDIVTEGNDSSWYNVYRETLIDWIIAWREFLTKYPDFVKNDEIKKLLNFITIQFIHGGYLTFDNDTLLPEVKQAYEKFLAKANKNSEEYIIVKQCYDILKKNNFKASSEFYGALIDYSKFDWVNKMLESYKYELNQQEQEKSKKEAILEYENLNYDTERMMEIYKEASDNYELHLYDKDENGNRLYGYAGSFRLFIGDYIGEHYPEYSNVYRVIWNYCYAIKECCNADMESCIEEELKNNGNH